MVDNVLDWAGVKRVDSVLDVGCGVGGSTRHIASRFGCKGTGITLSGVQVGIAERRTQKAGLAGVSFKVADALNMPFQNDSFDLVWSLESGEVRPQGSSNVCSAHAYFYSGMLTHLFDSQHMPDKAKFMSEMARVAAPGGRIILVTWCIRALAPGEADYSNSDKKLLAGLCKAYYLPQWCAVDRYVELAKDLGLRDVRVEDWSAEVQPFWRAVIETAFTWRGFLGLIKSGPTTIKGAKHSASHRAAVVRSRWALACAQERW